MALRIQRQDGSWLASPWKLAPEGRMAGSEVWFWTQREADAHHFPDRATAKRTFREVDAATPPRNRVPLSQLSFRRV